MTEHEVHGKTEQIKGKAKEAVGVLTGDKKLEHKGSIQRAEGTVEEGLGKASRKVGEVLTDIGDTIKK
jgi:uncharacterized protein YjbJ (UPF0337 family)